MTRLAAVSLALLRRAGWAPLAVLLFNTILSLGLGAYGRVEALDVPMHLLGGFAMAYLFASAFRALPARTVASDVRWMAELVVVLSLTATAAVFWELGEFFSDTLLGTGSQPSLEDTMFDMLLSIVGSAVYLATAGWRGNVGTVRPISRDF